MTRWPLIVVIAACGKPEPPAAPVAAAPPPLPAWSEATFATNVRATLERRHPGSAVETVEEDRLRLRPKVGNELEVSFAKAHAQCREDWAGCAAIVDHTL